MGNSLHMLMSADPRAVADCQGFVRRGDRVLLVGRGVDLVASLVHKDRAKALAVPVTAALESDVTAVGLREPARKAGLELWSDEEWVDQACRAERVLSWR